MKTTRLLPLALLAGAAPLFAQSPWDSSVRFAPQYTAYEIKTPFNEKVSEFSVPLFALVPVLPQLTIDIGSAFASAHLERRVDSAGAVQTTTSDLSGITDTQIRANYTFGQDFVVLTFGANIPTGSATLDPAQVEAATRIGSDFLTFPVSGFGSGLGFTGGVAVARPLGSWNVGFGASMRQSSEYEPFRDDAGIATRFRPGPEYRARAGMDHPFGTGSISFGLTFSKYGDDKSNARTFSSGDRYVGQFAVSNSLTDRVDYSLVVWDLYRTSGVLIDSTAAPRGNIANAMVSFGLRGPSDVTIEPSIESRVWAVQDAGTSFLGTVGLRFLVNRGPWSLVPGVGYSFGSMDSAALSGYRATLGIRVGG